MVHVLTYKFEYSDSDDEADTLYDVFESILSGLLVVLREGDLPKEIQDYIVNCLDPAES